MTEGSDESVLGPRQKRFLGFVLCFAGVMVFGCLLVTVVVVLNQIFDSFAGVIWPLAVAGVLSILLRPVVAFFERRLRLGRFFSVMLLYALVIGVAAGGVWFVAPKVMEQARGFADSAAEWPAKLDSMAEEWLPEGLRDSTRGIFGQLEDSWAEWFGSAKASSGASGESSLTSKQREDLEMARARMLEELHKQGESIARKSAEALEATASFLLSFFVKLTYLAVIPIYMFYFLGSRRNLLSDLEEELGFFKPGLREDLVFLVREFVGIIISFFRGQLLIGLLMGIGYAIGFTISGLKFGIALGLLFGFLNIVPYLGSVAGACIALPVAWFQPGGIGETGEWGTLLGCVISFAVVQLIESYLLTPRIMGRQTGLHPVAVIVAIFFWGTALGGILGMLFGIPLTAFIIVAWRLLRRKYLLEEAGGSEGLAET